MRRKAQIDVVTAIVLVIFLGIAAYLGYLYFFHKEAFNALMNQALSKLKEIGA